jgi:hypothetical protein
MITTTPFLFAKIISGLMSVGVLIPAIDQLIEKYAVYDAAPYYF